MDTSEKSSEPTIDGYATCELFPKFDIGSYATANEFEIAVLKALPWLEIFTVLPRGLRTIKVGLGFDDENDRFTRNVDHKAKDFGTLRRRLSTLAILLHRARRCAPDAVIVMGEWHMENIYPGKRPCFESEFHEVALPNAPSHA